MDERNGSGKYNGWTDLKSWVTNLWLENEEPSRRYWAEQAAAWAGNERAAVELAEQLEEEVTDAAPDLGRTLYADLMYAALSEVNWFEIAESHVGATFPSHRPRRMSRVMIRPC